MPLLALREAMMSCIRNYIVSHSEHGSSIEYGYEVWEHLDQNASKPGLVHAITSAQRIEYAMAASLFAVFARPCLSP